MLLKDLSDARGVSGNEGAVRELIAGALAGSVDESRVDALGNLICVRKARVERASSWPTRVMLAAHMDEVGLMVSGFNADGTLAFQKVGGIDDRVLLSKQVLVGAEAVVGVIGCRPIHLLTTPERTRAVEAKKLSIDIGATSKASAEKLAGIGDYVTFRTTFEVLDQGAGRIAKGKAFDDRVGCAVLVELLRDDYSFDLYGVFTAQEEVGLRGARTAAYAVEPDVAIALEGTICDDSPKEKDESPVTELGKGPAITLMDRSFVADRRLGALLKRCAEEDGIPFQYKQAISGGTDSGAIHLAREGVPAATVSVPCRYIHAPVNLVSLDDMDNAVRLMKAALDRINEGLPS